MKHLKEVRENYKISLNKLSVESGIDIRYLEKLEKGKEVADERVINLIERTLHKFNPNNELEILFDYVRIRFPTTDYKMIISNLLQMKFDYFEELGYGFYSYENCFTYGDISLMTSIDSTKGVLLELKGKGCRQFEAFLLAQKRTWNDFFVDCFAIDCIVKRLDIAIDDKVGMLNVNEIIAKCEQEEIVSVFKSFKSFKSGELVKASDGTFSGGSTLYIGSIKSDLYFCIYEKDKERALKTGVKTSEVTTKNRFEIRLKNEHSHKAVIDILTYNDIEQTAFGIVNKYIRFVEPHLTKRKSDWEMSEFWKRFIGEFRNSLTLSTKPEPYSIIRTINWLENQVAPTLKMLKEIDKHFGKRDLEEMIENATLSDKQKVTLKQMITPLEEVVQNKKR